MNILIVARIIASLLTAATGLLAFARPAAAYDFTGLYVPFPGSGVGTFDDVRQPPFFVSKFLV